MRRTYQVFTALALSSLFCFPLYSQNSEGTAYTLDKAIEYAINNNPNYLNAELDAKIAVARKKEITGLGFPQISGSLDVKNYLKIPTQFIPDFISPAVYGVLMQEGLIEPRNIATNQLFPVQFGTKYNATAGLQASQLIFSSDYIVGLQASKAFLELTEKAMERTKIETTVAVTKAYYQVLVSRKRAALMDANIIRIKKLLDDTRAMHSAGFVEQIDADRVEVTFNNLETEKQKIERLLQLSESMLKFQMGLPMQEKIFLSDTLSPVSAEVSAEIPKISYSSRVEYSLLENQQKLNSLDLSKNKFSYLPGIVGYANYSAQAQRNEFNFLNSERWYPIGLIGATMNVPIFDGFQKHKKIQQAKLNLQKTDNTMKLVANSIDLEIQVAKATYDNSIASLSTQQKNMTLAENVYKITKIKYDSGVGTFLEVINAETSYKEAQTNYFTALYDYYISKTDLDKATGSIK